MVKSCLNIVLGILILASFICSSEAQAFFGGGDATPSAVAVKLEGATTWREDNSAVVNLKVNLKNTGKQAVSGDFRVVVVVLNGTINFDQVLVTPVETPPVAGRSGFHAADVSIAADKEINREYQISMPKIDKEKIQVMAVLFGRGTDGKQETSRSFYIIPEPPVSATRTDLPSR